MVAATAKLSPKHSSLVLLRLQAYWNDIIAGAILLVVLITDGKIREAVDRLLRYQKYRKFIDPQAAGQQPAGSVRVARSRQAALETSEVSK